MAAKSGVRIVTSGPNIQALVAKSIKKLPQEQVLVGIPAEKAPRDGDEMNNAAIGYIMEYGAPDANIPARPWLSSGIREAQPRIVNYLKQAAQGALNGRYDITDKAMNAAGLVAVSSIRRGIQKGIAPALADSTLRARARRKAGTGKRITKGAKAELAARAAGVAPSTDFAKPLIDTGSLLASITYVRK